MPTLRAPAGPYRPTWESLDYYPVAPGDFYSVTGAPPQWSDQSDASYTWMKYGDAPIPGSPFDVGSTQPLVVVDLPACPGVTSITGVGFRANYVSAAPDNNPQAGWRLRNKSSGSIYAAATSVNLTSTPADWNLPLSSGSFAPGALSALQAGNLVVQVEYHGGRGEIQVYEAWLLVEGTIPEGPPPATVTLRRAIVPPQARVSPSLRQLQRGGPGGMSGIPRMVGNPVRGLRQGPGSVY